MDRYEANGPTYLVAKIAKVNNEEFNGVTLDSNNYEGEINHIGISHKRTRTPNEPLTEDEQTISRSELGKLIRIARIARHGAIYDASAAAYMFPGGGTF